MFVVPSDLGCSSWPQSSNSASGSFCAANYTFFNTILSPRKLWKYSFPTSRCRRRTPRVCANLTTVLLAMETKQQLNGRGVRKCECHDLHDQLVPYLDAWNWQKSLVASRCTTLEGELDLVDSVAILQHPPVYTMGTASSESFLHFDRQNPPFELHRTDRGGEVTYHGPGQLVMYPILNLRRYKMDLHWYLRSLEEVVIRAIWASCGIRASRIDGLTGVWIGDQKVAAIGVRVSRWITYHGLALNVDVDIAPFKNIVPCGIIDKFVGRIIDFLDPGLTKGSQQETLNQHCRNKDGNGFLEAEALQKGNASPWLKVIHDSLMVEFSEVFDVELVVPTLDGPCTLSQSLITN